MNKKQILVVEDERIVAEDIKASLQRLGYKACGVAHSGEDAIISAEEMQPDLVLMDIMLEGEMDGTEAASIIRSRFNTPIVYLTAHSDDKTLERAKVTEPFGYILKPFQDRDLHTTIEMALYKHKMGDILKTIELKYSSVVENAYDAIYVYGPDGFQYVNPAFEELLGWKKEELCVKKFDLWKTIHPEDQKSLEEKVGKKSMNLPTGSEFRIISKDKGMKTVEANTVIIGNNGDIKEIGILRDITDRKKAEEELKKSLERLQKTFEDTVNSLGSALERRDPYTAGHQKRVTNLASAIAKEMALPIDQIKGLRLAGLVHDVGKIQIPTEILIKPTHLSDIEFVLIKTHPQVGCDILKEIDFPYPIAQIVLQHHERMDGSGYPSGLKGEEILLEARIIAVADVVEAMSSHRPYRPAVGIDTALEEISQNKGVLYDPEVVDVFLRLIEEKKVKLE